MLSIVMQFACSAQVKLPRLISSGMVLQHGTGLKIWGWAAPGEKVTLLFNTKNYTATANAAGGWIINLPPQKPGGPYTMAFSASNNITLDNILFGDVWLCSGQSNMELGMDRLFDTYPDEVNAQNQNIRQFLVPDVFNFKEPQTDVASGTWQSVSPQTIGGFSGVAYFFAKEANRQHNIPIGIVNAALGGSPAQAWMSEAALQKFPEYLEEAERAKDDKMLAKIEEENKQAGNAWYAELNKKDIGLKEGYKKADYNDTSWNTMQVPGYWANTTAGNINGAVWFRKTIDVTPQMAAQPARLNLGRIVDADSVFINDVFVGTTSYQYPPRKYALKAGVLKPGKNTIAIRVISNGGRGGFVLDKEYDITAGSQSISLEGEWKYKVGCTMQPASPQVFIRWKSTGLYNGMIAPLQNYAIKGALWYQGESNAGKPEEYFSLMKELIADWRKFWKQDLPFIYVQLPNYMEEKKNPGNSGWATLRDQQAKLLTLKNTAMAVAIDLGEWNDIHPVNKKDVAHRLYLQAEKLVYGNKAIVASGPTVKAAKKEGNKVIISFNDTGSGLVAKGGNLKYFAIAGADGNYVWATATIKGNAVEVYSNDVPHPAHVSYAWADNPAGANLYNKEGLPAAPFKIEVK